MNTNLRLDLYKYIECNDILKFKIKYQNLNIKIQIQIEYNKL